MILILFLFALSITSGEHTLSPVGICFSDVNIIFLFNSVNGSSLQCYFNGKNSAHDVGNSWAHVSKESGNFPCDTIVSVLVGINRTHLEAILAATSPKGVGVNQKCLVGPQSQSGFFDPMQSCNITVNNTTADDAMYKVPLGDNLKVNSTYPTDAFLVCTSSGRFDLTIDKAEIPEFHNGSLIGEVRNLWSPPNSSVVWSILVLFKKGLEKSRCGLLLVATENERHMYNLMFGNITYMPPHLNTSSPTTNSEISSTGHRTTTEQSNSGRNMAIGLCQLGSLLLLFFLCVWV